MIGNLDPQRSFAYSILPPGFIPEDAIHLRIANTVRQVLSVEDFIEAYCVDNGRPSYDPVMMTTALLLGLNFNLSDREMEHATRYDLCWKIALGLPIEHKGICNSTFSHFRTRLVRNSLDLEIFDKCVEACRISGLLTDTALQVIDSTLIEGAAATQDTFTLIKTALRKVLREAKKSNESLEQKIRGSLKRKDYDEHGKSKIDWEDPEARRGLLEEMVRDAETAKKIVEESGDKDQRLTEAVELLDRVSHQDIEEVDGKIELKEGVAKDRVISTNDPEMRHGHKSSKGRVDGYKAHLVVEPKSGVITDVGVGFANGMDDAETPGAIDRLEGRGIKPEELAGDCAYGSGDAREEADKKDVEVISKVARTTNPGGMFSKQDFQIDLEAGKVTCPGGQTTTKYRMVKDGKKKRRVKAFVFAVEVCAACPLREQCTKNKKSGRTIRLNYHEGRLQEARKYQETEEFKEKYSNRPVAERTIADFKQHGGAKSRYIGIRKTKLQVVLTAVVVNIKKLGRWIFEKKAGVSLRGEYAHMMV